MNTHGLALRALRGTLLLGLLAPAPAFAQAPGVTLGAAATGTLGGLGGAVWGELVGARNGLRLELGRDAAGTEIGRNDLQQEYVGAYLVSHPSGRGARSGVQMRIGAVRASDSRGSRFAISGGASRSFRLGGPLRWTWGGDFRLNPWRRYDADSYEVGPDALWYSLRLGAEYHLF